MLKQNIEAYEFAQQLKNSGTKKKDHNKSQAKNKVIVDSSNDVDDTKNLLFTDDEENKEDQQPDQSNKHVEEDVSKHEFVKRAHEIINDIKKSTANTAKLGIEALNALGGCDYNELNQVQQILQKQVSTGDESSKQQLDAVDKYIKDSRAQRESAKAKDPNDKSSIKSKEPDAVKENNPCSDKSKDDQAEQGKQIEAKATGDGEKAPASDANNEKEANI